MCMENNLKIDFKIVFNGLPVLHNILFSVSNLINSCYLLANIQMVWFVLLTFTNVAMLQCYLQYNFLAYFLISI